MRAVALSGITGYFLGAVPCAELAAWASSRGMVDLREQGTGNPGAVNAMAVLGKRWGYGVLAADVAKAAVASGLGRRWAGSTGAHVAGTAAVVGHCFPVWRGFRGGKGVAASCGQCLATFPAYFPIDLLVALAIAKRKGRTLPATVLASGAWVGAGLLWWRLRLPNGWGPEPGIGLPLAGLASSAAIICRFIQSPIPAPAAATPVHAGGFEDGGFEAGRFEDGGS